ncbi:hypothetical protein ACFL6E_02375 [Candidatus Neomarinimicrobiota bacterium]
MNLITGNKQPLSGDFPKDKIEEWDDLLDMMIKGAKDSQTRLSVDANQILQIHGSNSPNAKDYFLYSALDEVVRAGLSIHNWIHSLKAGNDFQKHEGIQPYLTNSSIAMELSLWQRKLVEILINMICFSETNEEKYYRHFITVSEFIQVVFGQTDLIDFFSCPSENNFELIRFFKNTLTGLEDSDATLKNNWYRTNSPVPEDAIRDRARLMNSIRSRLKHALDYATPAEKFFLGFSYGFYSETSSHIHFTLSPLSLNSETADVSAGVDRCLNIGLQIIRRCQQLSELEPSQIITRILGRLDSATYPERVRRMISGRAEVGDFVSVSGYLGEIIEIRQSDFGYDSYRVAYLDERPMKTIEIDWHVPYDIRLLFQKKKLLIDIRDILEQEGGDQFSWDEVDPVKIHESIRNAAVDLWNDGLEQYVRNRFEQ